MKEYDQAALMELIGPDKIPVKGTLPAAWWISTDPEILAAYDRWKIDYRAHLAEVDEFGASIGLEPGAGLISGWGISADFVGFQPPHRMFVYGPDRIPVPPGWRIDSKSHRLVPVRKTKADRENFINARFKQLRKVPEIRAYMHGMPTELLLDHGFSGMIYQVNYHRGDACVWAYLGGDPDRADPSSRRHFDVDEDLWHRQKLSSLMLLREAAQEASRS
jgi:hypothetical protein